MKAQLLKTIRIRSIKLSVVALLSIAAVGCSSDDSPENLASVSVKPIRFGASANLSRSEVTTNNLTSFNVYAYTNTSDGLKLFMDNVKVTKNSTNVWTYSPVQYWPSHEAVDFYAYAPDDWMGSATPITAVPYDNLWADTDLVYAVSPNMMGYSDGPNAQVLFNFRHALSKVLVKLSSTNPDIQVRVSNVVLANIATKGNFHYPDISTSGSVTPNSVGVWTDQNTPHVYIYHMAQTPGDVVTLTSTPNDFSNTDFGAGGAKYLLPQPLFWQNGGSGNDTFLTVMCSMYDAKTGTKLWPNANTPEENIVPDSKFQDGLLRFPLSAATFNSWQPGNQYVYNVIINSNDEMGAIEFGDPSVDSYVDVEVNYH